MLKFRDTARKTWAFGAAAAMIIGSGAALGPLLGQSVLAARQAPAVATTAPASSTPPRTTGVYSVVDASAHLPSRLPAAQVSYYRQQGFTAAQIHQQYEQWIANMTPGPQDMSAQQAAAYAAPLLAKAYGPDLSGYTAKVLFNKGFLPNTESWLVTFAPPAGAATAHTYVVGVNALTGALGLVEDVSVSPAYNASHEPVDVSDPVWITKAQEDVARFLPAGVTITGSKVVGTKDGSVLVVCSLSDGSAIGVQLWSQFNDFPGIYRVFAGGYAGQWNIPGGH